MNKRSRKKYIHRDHILRNSKKKERWILNFPIDIDSFPYISYQNLHLVHHRSRSDPNIRSFKISKFCKYIRNSRMHGKIEIKEKR